jgi:hypothetical protein
MAYSFVYTLPTIAGSHSDFPLVVKTADFPTEALDGSANAILSGGGNLRAYTDDTKGTQLPLDVVVLTSSGSPLAVVWVKIPTAATGNTIYFEADEAITAQPAVAAAFGRNAVWTDYAAVLHLRESGDGTAGEFVDSSGKGRDGQLTNGPAMAPVVTAGHPFGDQWPFFENVHAITLANSADMVENILFNFSIYYNVTLLNNAKGLWGNRFNTSQDYAQMKLNGQTRVNWNGGDVVRAGSQASANATRSMQTNAGGPIEYYQDGALANSTSSGGLLTNTMAWRIGTYFDAASERFINGSACEARVRLGNLSSDWIATESANHTSSGDWATSSAWTAPAPTIPDLIMPSIFQRASYTSSSTASPFAALALDSQFTAAPNDERGYFLIEQADDKTVFANVQATITAGDTLTVNVIEFSTNGQAMPLFTGSVNIFSSLPITQYSEAQGAGRDGFLLIGDGNQVGNNGTTLSTAGYNAILDSVSADVLMLRKGPHVINAAHDGVITDADVVDQYTVAEEPLPHFQNVGNFPPFNSVGLGIPFAKDYFYRHPGARQTVLLPAGKTAGSISAGDYADSADTTYKLAEALAAEFMAESPDNRLAGVVIMLGLADSALSAQAGFQAGLDGVITALRAIYPNIPVVVCGLPSAFITANGAPATAIDAIIADTVSRFNNVGFADPAAGYVVDSSNQYLDATSMRLFGPVVYNAFDASFTNITL